MSTATVPVRTWSQYQHAIFDFVRNPNGVDGKRNAVVVAVAGSGKSTTIVEAMKYATGATLFLAFNKSIAEELKRRGVNARTFHSLTFSAVLRARGASTVTQDKLRILIGEMFPDDEDGKQCREMRLYGSFITKLVGLARNAGIGCLINDTVDAWEALIEHHDLELDFEEASIEEAIEHAQDLLNRSNESDMVDFDDMLYFAVRDGIVLPKFDFVFVDEGQDTNAIGRAIVRKVLKPTGRLIVVGDPAQAIYGFRGADSNSLDLIAEEFNCARLPLTVSYRCPTAVVEYAHQWVGHIEAAPNAPEGAVHNLGLAWSHTSFAASDLVVCRSTRPLVSLCYRLIRNRVPARIMGKDIGKGLVSLVKKLNAKGIDKLLEKLDAWAKRESEKFVAKGQDAKAENILDRAASVRTIAEGLRETDRTVPALIREIENLFTDKGVGVTLATIHKAKGLEAGRVFWLNRSQCPSPWARQEWQQQQERNLCYVATTRAQRELCIIEEPQEKEAA